MEESAPEPAPNSPQTARVIVVVKIQLDCSCLQASPCDAPAGRRLLAYYEDEEEEDGIENIEMEVRYAGIPTGYCQPCGRLIHRSQLHDTKG